MKRYTVRYERDVEGWWVATVPRVRGCHTQGRTLDEARRRIREALALFIDDANTVLLRDDIRLPADVKRMLERVARTRRQTDLLQRECALHLRKAVKQLSRRMGLSVRDQANLLGLSHQRVHQIIQQLG